MFLLECGACLACAGNRDTKFAFDGVRLSEVEENREERKGVEIGAGRFVGRAITGAKKEEGRDKIGVYGYSLSIKSIQRGACVAP